mgnify:CR=1 FL=1
MKNTISILLIVLVSQLFADNSKSTDKKYPFNYGKIQDNIYTNPYFGFSITVPANWTIQNKTQIDFVMSKGKDIIEFKDEAVSKAVDKMDISSMTLLMTSKHEIGAPVDFNPSIIIMAEDVSMYPGIKKGSDYLFQVKKQFQNSNMNYTMAADYDSLMLSDIKFDVLACTKDESIIHLNYLCAIRKKYALFFIMTYSNDDEKEELLNFVKTTQFQK